MPFEPTHAWLGNPRTKLVAHDFLARLYDVQSRASGPETSKIGNGWPDFFSRRGGFSVDFPFEQLDHHL